MKLFSGKNTMRNPNYELDSARIMRKYLSCRASELHLEALERVVKKYNQGSISREEASNLIDLINSIRNDFTNIKSKYYIPTSVNKLEDQYRAFT